MLKDIEEAAERWAEITCPIFGESSKRFVSAEGFGTGFLTSIKTEMYFFTAYHVLEDFKRYSVRIANIGGKAFDLDSLEFQGDKKLDIGFARVDAQQLRHLGLSSVKHCPLARDWSEWCPLEVFVAMGYPATRNELKLKFNSTDRHCLNIFASKTTTQAPKSALAKYLGIAYDPKKVTLSDGTFLKPPELKGISGGPCFQLMRRYVKESVAYSFRLRSVISELHPTQKIITTSPIEALIGT
ncbi:hypothetical protein [uncultured Aquimonas sp.]|uniref:hypothetical protein n=1 Tax=uncultured Aquimonas sp. TaxID=385483 RepID=UPI002609AEE8|nr:hypothetical protein [uncultured Aquimonas sp.]